MSRAANLDNIAPDDAVPPASPPPHSLPPKKKKKVHAPSIPPEIPNPPLPPSHSANLRFRQKIYELIKGKTASPLSAFLARPKVFTFQAREDSEEIILVLRRHWFTNLHWIVTAILMSLAPAFLQYFPILDFFPANYQFIFILFWYIITFAIAFEHFLSWYFNVFIITEERVVDIDMYNLLYTKFSEAKLSMIQDVTATQGGVSQTVLNYGTVLIQTASEIPVIKIERIPNPHLVVQILQQMRAEEEQEALDGRLQ
ncbi:MAG: PH domain-containing protein [Candidatus Shapirobacteria bacterium]|jgi:hypothetical protein